MKVVQKRREGDVVSVEATASEKEVAAALNAAQIAFAQANGLRPDGSKTPAKIAEEQLGIKDLDAIVAQNAIEALTLFAIDKFDVVPAYPPKAQPRDALKRGSTFAFDLRITLKPEYELSSYDPVEITVPEFVIDEASIDAQIADIAKNYTRYVADEPRALKDGDNCIVALKCFDNGEELKGMTTEGRPYTLGANLMPDGFDEAIIGMEPGETRQFSFNAPDYDEEGKPVTKPIECTLTLKEIQKAIVPEINDEWVSKNMPSYKTLEGLRADIRRTFEAQGRPQYESFKMQLATAELAKRFKGHIADAMYENIQANLVKNLQMQAQAQGKSWDSFVQENGGEQQLGIMLMLQTRETLTQGFALDAVFRHEKLSVAEEDILEVCRQMNPQMPAEQTRQGMEQSGRGFALRESAERYRASRFVLENAIVHIEEQ